LWVVGYGLDDCQTKRGWTCLFGIPKTENSNLVKEDRIFENDEYYKTIRAEISSKVAIIAHSKK